MSNQKSVGEVTNIMSDPQTVGLSNTTAPVARVRKSSRHLQDSKADAKLVMIVLACLFVAFMVFVRYSIVSRAGAVGNEANQSSDGLYYTMKISDREKDGIYLTMSITNTTGLPKTLDFSKDSKVDFVVQQQVNVFFDKVPIEIWRYSKANKNFSNQKVLTILPNEERVFSVKWDQTDNSGEKVNGGRYIVTGEIVTGEKNSEA
ncbi:MAG: BsuPI-related putative proteinase inhibitor [Candidatus Bruticola sp.]